MAGDDTIVVTEEAREMMRGLETNDPGEPSAISIRQVTGAHMSNGATTYRSAMSEFAETSHKKFQELLGALRADCATAVEALDDLNRQDEEIMAMLRNLDQETEAAAEVSKAATPSTGGPFVVPAGGGTGATAW